MTETLKAPFPYFGGKSRIAAAVWERFGRVNNFVEPFFGSGAVLLACPCPGHTETVNDADGLLANFWRALRADPDAVAEHADYPVSELDLHARHRWLVAQRADVERLLADPEWYDPKAAGWWVWGISQWIGSGWCPPAHVGDAGSGVHRAANVHARDDQSTPRLPWKRPHVGDAGSGVHRATNAHARKSFGKLPSIGSMKNISGSGGDGSKGIFVQSNLTTYLRALSARLRRTRVTCGDFARVLGPSVTWRHGTTAVFLDPPYDLAQRASVYAVETDAAHRARAWAIENGDNPLLRIALCGYDGEHAMPDGWKLLRWKAAGGYGSQADGRGRENAARECVWFSPHCLDFDALPMFAAMGVA